MDNTHSELIDLKTGLIFAKIHLPNFHMETFRGDVIFCVP